MNINLKSLNTTNYSDSINVSINVLPFINFVVSTTNSTLESSCWLIFLRADISWYVQPPIKKTRITFGLSMEEEFSLEIELRRVIRGCRLWSSSIVGPGREPNTSAIPVNREFGY